MIQVLNDWTYVTPERVPPQHWQDALACVAPYSERHSWLTLAWHPGTPEEPINRWAIYQMIPPRYVGAQYWAGDQPVRHDAKHNKWYPDPNHRLLLLRENMTHIGWRLYKETGHGPSLWWIIQGDEGGHRYKLDKIESKIAQMEWGVKDTPEPGELPYVDFDERVIDAIGPLDRIRQYKAAIEFAERGQERLSAEQKERAEDARRGILKYLRTQVRNNISEDRAAWRSWFRENARPITAEDKRRIRIDYEQAEDQLIKEAVA